MKLEHLETLAHAETLVAVALGAVVAIASSLAATLFEDFVRRRARERDAALMFGELLFTLNIYIQMAIRARGRGDPYGSITLRMLRGVQRELDIYDRNRETLYHLREGVLRVKTHGLVSRILFSLDRILDSTAEIAEGGDAGALTQSQVARDQAFDFLVQSSLEIPELVTWFGRRARHSFGSDAPAVPASAAESAAQT